DLDCRQCRPGGCAHGADGAALVYQSACRAADNRTAVAALQADARRGQPADALAAADRARAPHRRQPRAGGRDGPPVSDGEVQRLRRMGAGQALPGEESFRVSFDELARDRFVLGTPEEAIEAIEERITRLE